MKKLKFAAAALALTTAVGLVGFSACGDNSDGPHGGPPIDNPEDFVTVSVTQQSVTLKDYEVAGFSFSRYFRISDNGTAISVNNYIDTSALKAEAGSYEVKCTYKEHTASITVNVIASDCRLTLSKEEIKLNTSEIENYDFKALFSLTVDGSRVEITEDMITSDVKAEAGIYSYTVTFFSASATLTVTVVDENSIEII